MSALIVRFVVPGVPVAKGRARSRIARAAHGREFVHHYTPPETKRYEKQIAVEAKIAMGARKPVDNAVSIVVNAFYPIPPSWPHWRQRDARAGVIVPIVKPDWDNVGKAISDAMNGVVYGDDAAVVDATVRKRYSIDPRVEITVYAFEPNPTMRADDAFEASGSQA